MIEGNEYMDYSPHENYSDYENSTNQTYFWGNHTDEGLYEPALSEVIVISLVYCGISLTAVIGNSTVILIVLTSRRMQSVTNFFIANLALADVIIGLFAIPFQFQAALLQRWNLPSFLCPFCPFFQNLSVNASIFTLTAIAVDRYKAIMFPLKSHASKSRTKLVIVIIWIISTVLAIPMAIAFRTVDVHQPPIAEYEDPTAPVLLQCLPMNIPGWMPTEYFKWYKNMLCLVQYFIPLVIISVAYIRMACALWSARTPGAAQMERDRVMMNNKKKVIKMLMTVVALFTLAWLPLQLYDVLNQIFEEINYYQYINIIWFCIHWLAMSNSCYNPFIYLLCNDKFQKELRLKMACCMKQSRPRHSIDLSTAMVLKNGDTFRRRRLRGQGNITETSYLDQNRTPKQGDTSPNRNNNFSFTEVAKHSNGYPKRLAICSDGSSTQNMENEMSEL